MSTPDIQVRLVVAGDGNATVEILTAGRPPFHPILGLYELSPLTLAQARCLRHELERAIILAEQAEDTWQSVGEAAECPVSKMARRS